ncbi:MAG: redoxin domain-containing protein [Bacteroidetes bacterium]|nr:redoxin domain-containing protein [Fibrella sp.]
MKKILFIVLTMGTLATLTGFLFGSKSADRPATAMAPTKTLYDFTVTSLDGKPVALKKYEGKKVVIMNTASKCGFTPQYADWEKFYKEHGDKVVVLGFPANNFMSQEPGSSTEIASFCQKNYGVTFPMFEKVSVTGDDKSPLYKWLTTKSLNGWNDKEPSWNFCKYVIDEKGVLTNFFSSNVKPNDAAFRKAVGI